MSINTISGAGPVTPPIYAATTGQAASGSLPHNGTAYYMPLTVTGTGHYGLCVYGMVYLIYGYNRLEETYYG